VHGCTGPAVPKESRLALVGDADGGDVGSFEPGLGERGPGGIELGLPNLERIVFNPARFRIKLLELTLDDSAHLARMIKDDRARTGSSLVEGENGRFHGRRLRSDYTGFIDGRRIGVKPQLGRDGRKVGCRSLLASSDDGGYGWREGSCGRESAQMCLGRDYSPGRAELEVTEEREGPRITWICADEEENTDGQVNRSIRGANDWSLGHRRVGYRRYEQRDGVRFVGLRVVAGGQGVSGIFQHRPLLRGARCARALVVAGTRSRRRCLSEGADPVGRCVRAYPEGQNGAGSGAARPRAVSP